MPASSLITAPGKLVVIGEYAVLDGAPALVVAIDRGVGCEVDATLDRLRIETPDGDDRFVRPALEGCVGHYRFFDWNPVDLPGKPGFGGSAAACVAACVAAGRPASDAFGIHFAVQGSGSGIDVAAAVHGGLLRFEAGAAAPLAETIRPTVVYSGASARTGPRVEAYRRWADRGRFVQQSAAITAGFFSDPIGALDAAGDLLESMAADAGIAYTTPALDRIRALARRHGGAAKASGAGGGDCAIALLPEWAAEAAFSRDCAAEGLPVIPVSVAAGAHRDSGGNA